MATNIKTHTKPSKALLKALEDTNIVLVGPMGSGKSAIGTRLATTLKRPFKDVDREIEQASNMTISDMFEQHGETYFRDGERRVMARLMKEKGCVIATGGGAIVNDETRELIKQKSISIWLDANLDVLMERVGRRKTRPLLQKGNAREIMANLLEQRQPYYQQADIKVTTAAEKHEAVIERTLNALSTFLNNQ